MAADPALGLVYLPVETPTSDYYGGHRPGNNLFAESIVAVDVKTGQPQVALPDWCTTRSGASTSRARRFWPTSPWAENRSRRWRSPASSRSSTSSIARRGSRCGRSKSGRCRTATCPASGTRRRSRSRPGRRRTIARAIRTTIWLNYTPELRAAALKMAARYKRGPIFTPPSLATKEGTLGTISLSAGSGGTNWPGGAYDPETHVLYVPSQSASFYLWDLIPNPGPEASPTCAT